MSSAVMSFAGNWKKSCPRGHRDYDGLAPLRTVLAALLVVALCGPAAAQTPEESVHIRDDGQAFVLWVPRANITLILPKGEFQSSAPDVKAGATANPRYFIFRHARGTPILSGWIESASRFNGVRPPDPIRLDGMTLRHEKVTFGKVGDWQTVSSELTLQGTAVAKLNAHLVREGTWIELNLTANHALPIEEQHASLKNVVASLSTGYSAAERAARVLASAAQREQLNLNWPDMDSFTVANRQNDERITLIEIVPRGQTLENWTQIGTVVANKNLHFGDVRAAYERYSAAFTAACPNVRLAVHFVEQSAAHPRLIFSRECPRGPGGYPESGVWLLIQSPTSLYVLQRGLKAQVLPEDLRTQWVELLKNARVVASNQ